MSTFKYWNNEFSQQNMHVFNNASIESLYYLKARSIFRKNLMEQFEAENSLPKQTLESLYNLLCDGTIALKTLDNFILKQKQQELKDYSDNFDDIKSELYKLQHYAWGGDKVNSLDKKIVSIVKSHYKYDEIISQLDNQIKTNVEKYTVTSWFITWSAILTEYLFKREDAVIPALSKMKSIDFFIDDVPLDLKTTFFPQQFIKKKRRINELTELKSLAKLYNCVFDKTASPDTIKYQIIEQLLSKNNLNALNELEAILKKNTHIIDEAIANPDELIKWLYENQGETRFGSENRLFLVLVDKNKPEDSWKLKRDFDKLQDKISSYIHSFKKDQSMRPVTFEFKGKTYKTLADCLFIIK